MIVVVVVYKFLTIFCGPLVGIEPVVVKLYTEITIIISCVFFADRKFVVILFPFCFLIFFHLYLLSQMCLLFCLCFYAMITDCILALFVSFFIQ